MFKLLSVLSVLISVSQGAFAAKCNFKIPSLKMEFYHSPDKQKKLKIPIEEPVQISIVLSGFYDLSEKEATNRHLSSTFIMRETGPIVLTSQFDEKEKVFKTSATKATLDLLGDRCSRLEGVVIKLNAHVVSNPERAEKFGTYPEYPERFAEAAPGDGEYAASLSENFETVMSTISQEKHSFMMFKLN